MRWNKQLAVNLALWGFATTLGHAQSPSPVHKQKYVMGAVFEVVSYDSSPAALAAMDRALQEAVRLDGIMSNYKSDSDLSRLNHSAHFHFETVPADLYRIIETSLTYSQLSNGKFDITVGPLVNYWKSVLHGERAPSRKDEEALRRCVGYKNIVLLPPDRVEFSCGSTEIDLGAIGKGYAVDRMVEILRSRSVFNALVNAGGSTFYGLGCPPGESGWRVRVRDPSGKTAPEVRLLGNSVSTSEQSAPSLFGSDPAGHIVDPENGDPVKTAVAVSAVAETATESDALSTTLLLIGQQKGSELIKNTAGTAAIWISPSGQVQATFNGGQISYVVEGHADDLAKENAR